MQALRSRVADELNHVVVAGETVLTLLRLVETPVYVSDRKILGSLSRWLGVWYPYRASQPAFYFMCIVSYTLVQIHSRYTAFSQVVSD